MENYCKMIIFSEETKKDLSQLTDSQLSAVVEVLATNLSEQQAKLMRLNEQEHLKKISKEK